MNKSTFSYSNTSASSETSINFTIKVNEHGSVYFKAYFKNIDNVQCLEISTIQ